MEENKAYGIFNEHINNYEEIKLRFKGTSREMTKQFLNNLYGKMASSTPTSFKVVYDKSFYTQPKNNKLHGVIYADTDSIYCDIPSEEIIGISVPNGVLLVDTDYKMR